MDLFEQKNRKRVLIAAHRGSAGGNIPCNSISAFKIALLQGADIIELDVEKSLDGVLFVQHPGFERVHLRMNDSIRNYPSHVVEQFVLSNCDVVRTKERIPRLADALRFLKGKCVINIDKFWNNPQSIAQLVRDLGMVNDVIIKTYHVADQLDAVEKYAPDLPLMVMVRDEDHCTESLLRRNIRYIGTEVLFANDTAPVASAEYVDWMHRQGLLVWANAIVYNDYDVVGGGHTDDISLLGDPDNGWGWLCDRGFDIIQTDFTLQSKLYLEQTGRRTVI